MLEHSSSGVTLHDTIAALRGMGTKSDDLPISPRRQPCKSIFFRLFVPKVEADIAPFRALLLGMFFMTVGFEIDLALCFNNLPLVASLVSASSVTRVHALCRFCC